MLTPGYSAPTGAVRRVFRPDRFAVAGACLGYGEMSGRISIEKRFDMLEARVGGETRFDLRLKVEKILKAETARGRATVQAEMSPRVFDGVLAGRSTVTGALLVRKQLTSAAAASAVGKATVLIEKELSAAVAGAPSFNVLLEVRKQLGAAAYGVSAPTSALTVRKNLRVWPAGQASASALPLIEKQLGASASGAPSFDVRLQVEKILGVQPITGTSSAAGLPLIEKILASSVIGHADAVATVRVAKQLGALTGGSADVEATLLTQKQLTGSLSALGASTGALTVKKILGAQTAAGTGAMTGRERIWKRLETSTSGAAIVSATMEPPVTYRRTQSDDIRETMSGDVRRTERDVN